VASAENRKWNSKLRKARPYECQSESRALRPMSKVVAHTAAPPTRCCVERQGDSSYFSCTGRLSINCCLTIMKWPPSPRLGSHVPPPGPETLQELPFTLFRRYLSFASLRPAGFPSFNLQAPSFNPAGSSYDVRCSPEIFLVL